MNKTKLQKNITSNAQQTPCSATLSFKSDFAELRISNGEQYRAKLYTFFRFSNHLYKKTIRWNDRAENESNAPTGAETKYWRKKERENRLWYGCMAASNNNNNTTNSSADRICERVRAKHLQTVRILATDDAKTYYPFRIEYSNPLDVFVILVSCRTCSFSSDQRNILSAYT